MMHWYAYMCMRRASLQVNSLHDALRTGACLKERLTKIATCPVAPNPTSTGSLNTSGQQCPADVYAAINNHKAEPSAPGQSLLGRSTGYLRISIASHFRMLAGAKAHLSYGKPAQNCGQNKSELAKLSSHLREPIAEGRSALAGGQARGHGSLPLRQPRLCCRHALLGCNRPHLHGRHACREIMDRVLSDGCHAISAVFKGSLAAVHPACVTEPLAW